MKEPAFSPLAVEDLRGILQYISRDNPERAATFLEALKEKCRTLARFPLLGASRDNLVPGLRVFSVGSYVSTIVRKAIRCESSEFSMVRETSTLSGNDRGVSRVHFLVAPRAVCRTSKS